MLSALLRLSAPSSAFLLVLTGIALVACKESSVNGKAIDTPGVTEARPPLVRAEAVALRQVQQKIETTAFIEAEHTVVVVSRVVGRVHKVLVDEGAQVEKGQVLARLDDREILTTLRQAEVQVADRKLRLELAKLEVEATQHREEQARFEMAKAERDLVRFQKLEADLVSPRDLDDAQYAKDRATAALRVAEFLTRKAKLDVDTADAGIQDLESKLTEVKIQVAEHVIQAPMAGVVSRRMVKGGEAISMTTELFEVVDTSSLIAYLDRPQRELALVQNAKKVRFHTDAYPGQVFHASVDLISPVVDRSTGSFKIRVRVGGEDAAKLRPGLFIRAQILTEENRKALMIPKTAVIADGDESVVFFVRDPLENFGKARRMRLETGIEDDSSVECRNTGTSALHPGDLIIVSGQQDLRDQTRVELSRN